MGVGIPGETRSYGEENGGLVLGAPKLEVIEEDVFPIVTFSYGHYGLITYGE